jgi:hypothetical protein
MPAARGNTGEVAAGDRRQRCLESMPPGVSVGELNLITRAAMTVTR